MTTDPHTLIAAAADRRNVLANRIANQVARGIMPSSNLIDQWVKATRAFDAALARPAGVTQ